MRTLMFATMLAATAVADEIAEKYPVAENVRGHENTEWSISYAYHLTDAKKNLPRVLLVGDSICQGYQGKVAAKLDGKANVTYWASSYCVTSPGYLRLLAFYLDEAKYDVIHFNNGLHSCETPVADYEKAYRNALRLVKDRQPGAKIVWASSTPINATDSRAGKVAALNAAARRAAQAIDGISTDDLFALMDPLDRVAYWTDAYHYKDAGYELIASQVVERVTEKMTLTGAQVTRGEGLYRCQVHRGGGRDTRPDNSLETFLWCWGHGVAPEADARLTKDGVAIAFHDSTLQRIGRGISGELKSREIKDMTWNEIKDVDVGSYLGDAYASTRIATMDSIFAAMSGRPDRILYLDEKGAPAEMMAEMAKKHGVEKQIYYTSPNFRLMSRWQKVVPGGLGMVWLGTWAKDNSPASVAKADEFLERTFREMDAEGWSGISQIQLHIRTDLTKPDPFCPSTECLKKSIELLHSKGITVQAFTWTEGANKDVLRRIWSLGFDNFATDDPLVLFELLPELRKPALSPES